MGRARGTRSQGVIRYPFEAETDDGRREYAGSVATWDKAAAPRESGQEIHVLSMPDDPDQNTLYPP